MLRKNLVDDTFTSQDINLFLVLNTQGEIIYGKAYDIINAQDAPLAGGPAGVLVFVIPEEYRRPRKTEFQGVTMLSANR